MEKIETITREIIELKRNLGQNTWMLGNRLNEVKENKLYLEKYGMFEEYLDKAVDISRSSAYSFMKIANEFDVQALGHWGSSKIGLLLSLEEPMREEVFKLHKPEDSFREVKETVHRLKSESQPEVNQETDFFMETENTLRALKESLADAKLRVDACQQKGSFNNYLRKQVILNLWEELKQ